MQNVAFGPRNARCAQAEQVLFEAEVWFARKTVRIGVKGLEEIVDFFLYFAIPLTARDARYHRATPIAAHLLLPEIGWCPASEEPQRAAVLAEQTRPPRSLSLRKVGRFARYVQVLEV